MGFARMSSEVRTKVTFAALLIISLIVVSVTSLLYGGMNTRRLDAAARIRPITGEVSLPVTASHQIVDVGTSTIAHGTLDRIVHATGAVAVDETRVVQVNLKLDGWIRD